MKKYYQNMLDELKTIDSLKKLLLHSCCGPCSTHVIDLLTKYFNITVYFYNPNVVPKEEYLKRKAEQVKFINNYRGKNKITFIEGDYDYGESLKYCIQEKFIHEGGAKCYRCYQFRLRNTARLAKDKNFDYFSTTLSVSPYKNSEYINEIGEELAKEFGVKFLSSDFKKEAGYKNSVLLSKKYNLYRQQYCGCLDSLLALMEKFK